MSVWNQRLRDYVSPGIESTPNVPQDDLKKTRPKLILPPNPPSTEKSKESDKTVKPVTVMSSIIRYQALGIDTAMKQIDKFHKAEERCVLHTYNNKLITVEEVDEPNKCMVTDIEIKPIETEKFSLAEWIVHGGEGHGPTLPNTDPNKWDEVVFWLEKGGEKLKFYYNKLGASDKKLNENNPAPTVNDPQEFLTTIGVEESLIEWLIQ